MAWERGNEGSTDCKKMWITEQMYVFCSVNTLGNEVRTWNTYMCMYVCTHVCTR